MLKIQKAIVGLTWGVSFLFLLLWFPVRPPVLGFRMENEVLAFWSVVFSMSVSTTLALGLLKNLFFALPGILILPFFYLNVLLEATNGPERVPMVGATGIVVGYLWYFFLTVCGTLLIWSYKNRGEQQNADERAPVDTT